MPNEEGGAGFIRESKWIEMKRTYRGGIPSPFTCRAELKKKLVAIRVGDIFTDYGVMLKIVLVATDGRLSYPEEIFS